MDRSQPPTLAYTYADLRRIHTERLEAAHKSVQHIRNHDSALNLFASAVGKSDACECGQDFGERFEVHLAMFTDALTARGVSAAGIANNVSCIRAIRLTFNAMVFGATGSDSFQETLYWLLKSHNMSHTQLSRETGITRSAIDRWLTGSVPSKMSIPSIKKVEALFNIPPGTLVGKIDFRFYQPTLQIQSRQRLHALTKDRYMYKEPTEAIRAEWAELLHFRTAPYLANGMQRNSTWRVKSAERMTYTKPFGWESVTPSGFCVTASIVWNYVGGFLGYLLRDKSLGGMGMKEEQLSLALLTDASLVLGYIEFRKSRSGVYTGEMPRTLSVISAFLRKDTGFFWQLPKYGERLPTPVSTADWHGWCERNKATLIKVCRELQKGGHIQKGRDPQEPIAKIIAEQHPIRVLLKMVENMNKRFFLAQSDILRAAHKRDVLLVKMLISNPLRVHHYSIMKYFKDNTGNLYQDSASAWRLRFQPVDFKNQRGAAAKDYDVGLSPWLFKDIQKYLEIHRQFLLHADTSDHVFLNSVIGGTKRWPFFPAVSISTRITKLTREYIPDCPGFAAHAFRHIVATDYIKNNPNGFQVAANILHDKLETVMKEYAHVKVADGFSHWTSYLGEQVDIMGVGDE